MDESDVEKLRAQNALLNKQLRLFVRTEQRLHQAQNDLELQLRRVRQLDELALAASRSKTRDEIFAYAFSVVMDLWAAQGAIVIENFDRPVARAAMLDQPMTELEIPADVIAALRESPRAFAYLIPDGSRVALVSWIDDVTADVEGERPARRGYRRSDAIVPLGQGVLIIRTSGSSPHEPIIEASDTPFLDLLGRHLTPNLERVQLHATLEAEIRERTFSLSALGTLAAGVAHEINNPLTFILHNQTFVKEVLEEIARGQPPTPADLAESLATVQHSIDGLLRIRDIVADLTMYAEAVHESPEDEETQRASVRMRNLSTNS